MRKIVVLSIILVFLIMIGLCGCIKSGKAIKFDDKKIFDFLFDNRYEQKHVVGTMSTFDYDYLSPDAPSSDSKVLTGTTEDAAKEKIKDSFYTEEVYKGDNYTVKKGKNGRYFAKAYCNGVAFGIVIPNEELLNKFISEFGVK